MSPSSPRGRFWRRIVLWAALLWVVWLVTGIASWWRIYNQLRSGTYTFSDGSGGGLAVVSFGVSEFIVESIIMIPVMVAVVWAVARLWLWFAKPRGENVSPP